MHAEAEILRRLARETQSAVADAAHMDASVVNRIASGAMGVKLAHLGPFLAALGLRLVDKDACEIAHEELDALRTLAGRYLNTKKEAE